VLGLNILMRYDLRNLVIHEDDEYLNVSVFTKVSESDVESLESLDWEDTSEEGNNFHYFSLHKL
jgi:hypothetical protein